MYNASKCEQEKSDRFRVKRLQGLEYPEEMRYIKESSAALLMSVPLHDFDKKKRSRHDLDTSWREIHSTNGSSKVRKEGVVGSIRGMTEIQLRYG